MGTNVPGLDSTRLDSFDRFEFSFVDSTRISFVNHWNHIHHHRISAVDLQAAYTETIPGPEIVLAVICDSRRDRGGGRLAIRSYYPTSEATKDFPPVTDTCSIDSAATVERSGGSQSTTAKEYVGGDAP